MKEKIKNRIDYLYSSFSKKYERWRKQNFIPSSKLMYWVALVLVSIDITYTIGRIMVPEWIGNLIVMSICIILGILIRIIIGWLSTLLFRHDINEFISMLMIIGVTISGVTYFGFKLECFKEIVIGTIIGILFILFLKSLWSLWVGKLRTRFNIGIVFGGSVLISMLICFLNSKGFEDTYIKTYLQLEKTANSLTKAQRESFENAVGGGKYTVSTVIYDLANADMISKTVNLEGYAKNQGFSGYIKEKYQGYGLDQVPIRGKVWYPQEVSQCPTLFIIHGNHDYLEESYLGYEYLGQYLAAYGYVMVSIDENACNLLTNENDARAILLLENIAQLQAYNQMPQNPLYQKIDEMHLAIAGHSRGGEAVNVAYLFNEEAVNPNNGSMRLDYHFNIRSIIAIAPTIDQYKPTDKSVVLQDVNYLVIHGANDQDLYNFGGIKQYKNIRFTGKGDYIKTALYCAGCNHGQFNSRWGLYDLDGIYHRILNVKNFLSEHDQQEIADIFIKIFLDCTLKEDKEHISLLEDYRVYRAYLPRTLYVESYQKSDFKVLCNFEEDTSLSTGTMEGVIVDVMGGNVWTEGLYPVEAVKSNSAIYLQWTDHKTPTLSVAMPKLDMTNRTLQFDIMNLEEGFKEEDAKLLEASIVLEDALGNSQEVLLSDYATIYPAFLVRLNKLQYLLDEVEYKHQFQTVSIPIAAFKEKNNQLQLGQIVSMKIILTDEKGTVAIDEIGY